MCLVHLLIYFVLRLRMLYDSYTVNSLKQQIKHVMGELSLDKEPHEYKYVKNARELSKNAVYNLASAIQTHRDQGGSIAEPFMPMIYVIMAVEYGERSEFSLIKTYYAIRKTIYSHQAAYVNTEGYLSEYNKIYDYNSLSDRAKRIIHSKEINQLKKDTEYLRLKFMVSHLDIRYATEAYQKYLLNQQLEAEKQKGNEHQDDGETTFADGELY